MGNKHLALAITLTLLLVALAFFLPDRLALWRDDRLLDTPKITGMAADQEGFAESIRLTVPEKLLLLRGRNLSSVALPEEGIPLPVTIQKAEGGWASIRQGSKDREALGDAGETETEAAEEAASAWTERTVKVLSELRALQKAGAMPYLWQEDSEVSLADRREILYIDNDTQVTFLVYYMELSSPPYALNLSVDAQTGKFLTVTIRWNRDGLPAWGTAGIQNFGSAWRDYWGMDGVDLAYLDSKYIRGLLMETETLRQLNGDYSSSAEIGFSYGGQTIRVPLLVRAVSDWGCSIQWNI